MLNTVKIYGLPSCPQTMRAMTTLKSIGVGFDFFDLSIDRHAAAWVKWKHGDLPTPTIMVGLRVLANPAVDELRSAVTSKAA